MFIIKRIAIIALLLAFTFPAYSGGPFPDSFPLSSESKQFIAAVTVAGAAAGALVGYATYKPNESGKSKTVWEKIKRFPWGPVLMPIVGASLAAGASYFFIYENTFISAMHKTIAIDKNPTLRASWSENKMDLKRVYQFKTLFPLTAAYEKFKELRDSLQPLKDHFVKIAESGIQAMKEDADDWIIKVKDRIEIAQQWIWFLETDSEFLQEINTRAMLKLSPDLLI